MSSKNRMISFFFHNFLELNQISSPLSLKIFQHHCKSTRIICLNFLYEAWCVIFCLGFYGLLSPSLLNVLAALFSGTPAESCVKTSNNKDEDNSPKNHTQNIELFSTSSFISTQRFGCCIFRDTWGRSEDTAAETLC